MEPFVLSARRKKISQESKASKSVNRFVAPATALTVVGFGAAGYYSGVLPELLDNQIVPQSPVLAEAVDGMVSINEAIRSAAPVVGVGMLATMAYYKTAGRFNTKQATLNQLSKVDYSGIDDMVNAGTEKHHRLSRIKRTIGGVAVLSATLIMATSGLEKDVSGGSLRPIESITSVVATNGEELQFIVESQKNTFMDDSVIPSKSMNEVIADATDRGITVLPFSKELMNVNDESAIELSLPDTVFSKISGENIDEACNDIPVIVDSTIGAKIGDTININNTPAQVVKIEDNLAQMNRRVVLVSDTDMRKCLKDSTDDAYFGALVPGASEDEVSRLLAVNNIQGMSVVDKEQFFENNKDFWRANGTPLILILMGSVAVLGGVASANERRSALSRNVREIGMMNANGVSMDDIRRVESRRALRESISASAVGAVLSPVVAAGFNASVTGLQVGVGLREIAVGSGITWLSTEIAARRAVKNLGKQINITQAVKG